MSTKVLIVEDDADFAASLVLALSLKQMDVDTARTGEEGVEKFLAGDYRVTVTDIKLPDFDGIEVIRRIRARNPEAVVLVMTGYRDAELLERARQAGASEIMLKPFRMSEFIDKVHHADARES